MLVDPTEVAEVGPLADAEEVPPAPSAAGRIADPEAEDDLGSAPTPKTCSIRSRSARVWYTSPSMSRKLWRKADR